MVVVGDPKSANTTPLTEICRLECSRVFQIENGDELPSRRVLSARLGVNPNTVQKAYRLLEEAGLIASHAGAKSFVSAGPAEIEAVRAQLLTEEARRLVEALRQTGASREEAMALLGRLWDEKEETQDETT